MRAGDSILYLCGMEAGASALLPNHLLHQECDCGSFTALAVPSMKNIRAAVFTE
jgi:hypothetical protein